MKITYNVEPESCMIALMWSIGVGDEIKNKKQFKRSINNYFASFGFSSLDDHQIENIKYGDEALATWNKYGEAVAGRELTPLEEQANDALSES